MNTMFLMSNNKCFIYCCS